MILDRTQVPPIRKIDDFSVLAPETQIMPNGIPLHVIHAGTEDVIRLDIMIHGGAWHQDIPLQAMFTNRMLREGTSRLDAGRIAEELDYYGAWLDLSSSVAHGFITLYTLKKYFRETLEIVAQMLKEPTFPEKELAVIVDVNRQQFLVNSQRVDVMARKQFNRALFGLKHPLGRYAELKDYDAISSDCLKSFYAAHYHSGNCSMYVSGKVTPDVIACIERNFGCEAWGDTRNKSVWKPSEIETDSRKYIFLEKEDALQSSLKVGELSLDLKHPDFLKLRVAVTILGGYFGSRLMSNIREEKGYTYGIGAGLVNYPGLGVFGISTEAANEYIPAILTEIKKEIKTLQDTLVSTDELEMVRNYMLGDLCRSYENALSLPDAWIYLETFGLDKDFYEKSISAITQVTPEEILRLAQTYFCEENLTAIVAGKKMS